MGVSKVIGGSPIQSSWMTHDFLLKPMLSTRRRAYHGILFWLKRGRPRGPSLVEDQEDQGRDVILIDLIDFVDLLDFIDFQGFDPTWLKFHRPHYPTSSDDFMEAI